MIITNILGGLGNQMFQYAAGRSLAHQTGQQFLLDISAFDDYKLHNGFELTRIFSIHNQFIASNKDFFDVLGWQSNVLLRRLLSRHLLSFLRKNQFIQEPHFQYWDGFNCISQDAYIQGYWQSYKYFQLIESIIRSDFIFKEPMSVENQKIADQITNCCAVSLHIRRGDYVENPVTLAKHGLCSLQYYLNAVEYIATNLVEPKFFIFSDDIAWVKEHLKINYSCEYIDINHGLDSYNDMRLMSLCHHNIIANSSFSWWGAWLNSNLNKIVIAPKRWFFNKTNTYDLIPEDWVRL